MPPARSGSMRETRKEGGDRHVERQPEGRRNEGERQLHGELYNAHGDRNGDHTRRPSDSLSRQEQERIGRQGGREELGRAEHEEAHAEAQTERRAQEEHAERRSEAREDPTDHHPEEDAKSKEISPDKLVSPEHQETANKMDEHKEELDARKKEYDKHLEDVQKREKELDERRDKREERWNKAQMYGDGFNTATGTAQNYVDTQMHELTDGG